MLCECASRKTALTLFSFRELNPQNSALSQQSTYSHGPFAACGRFFAVCRSTHEKLRPPAGASESLLMFKLYTNGTNASPTLAAVPSRLASR